MQIIKELIMHPFNLIELHLVNIAGNKVQQRKLSKLF